MNKLKNITVFLSLLSLVLVGTVESAQAELITWYFMGQITSVSTPPPYGLNVNVGDLVTGSIAYDPSLPYVQPPPSGMSIAIGGATVQSEGDASLQVLNNSSGVDNFNGYFTPISVNGENKPSGSHAIVFYLADTSQTVFSSTALPDSLDINSFDIRTGSIFAGLRTVSFSIDSLSLSYSDYIDIASLQDINGSGVPEVAALRVNPLTGVSVVDIRDAHTRTFIKKISFFSVDFIPKALTTVPDMNGNGFSELAVLGVNKATGATLVMIKDAKSKARLNTIRFFNAQNVPKGMTVVPDMNGNGSWELSVLGVNKATGAVMARIKDAKTRALVKDIVFAP